MKRILFLALCVCLIFAGRSGAGQLAADWQKQKHGKPTTQPAKAARAADVSEIGIERTPCYGTCPVYILILKRDGTFHYRGVLHVKHKGDFKGSIPKEKFEHLAKMMIDSGFMSLDDHYTRPVTDNPTVYTMGVIGGYKKIILDYAAEGPQKLRDLESAISDALEHATWQEEKSAS
jgi:hypothetical protein